MHIAREIPQAPPQSPLHFSFNLLPTSSVVTTVTGRVSLRCMFGVEHLLDVIIHRVINSRSDPEAINLAEAVIHDDPGAPERLTQYLVDIYLRDDLVDPCILDEPAPMI